MENPIEKEINKIISDNSPVNQNVNTKFQIQKKHTGFWVSTIIFIISIIFWLFSEFIIKNTEPAGASSVDYRVYSGVSLIVLVISLVCMIIFKYRSLPKSK